MKNENLSGLYIPNILIVDDIPANLKVLGGILKDEGYKIRPVLNGEMALQVAEKEIPDLILLDIMMPDMDGYEVCCQLKANPRLKDIPVIFISALNDTKDIVSAFSIGGVDYITKPFQAEEVKARIATHLKICRQNKELKELNATKDKFFSIIAHDLRGPIGSMMQISEFVTMKEKMDEETLYSFLESQKELSRNTFYLLENLLSWARSSTNQIDYYPEILDVNTILKASIENIKTQATSKNITVTANYTEQSRAYADQKMFRLIIRNLLSNAIKFTPQGGTISISAAPAENDSVIIAVKDTGIGMSPKILENLFRIDISSNRPGTDGESSNGLGLLLCKEFVEKNGGKIWIDSEEDKGSTFWVTLPSHADLN
jgi:two-component system, sensor histidine kinase and response regulator